MDVTFVLALQALEDLVPGTQAHGRRREVGIVQFALLEVLGVKRHLAGLREALAPRRALPEVGTAERATDFLRSWFSPAPTAD